MPLDGSNFVEVQLPKDEISSEVKLLTLARNMIRWKWRWVRGYFETDILHRRCAAGALTAASHRLGTVGSRYDIFIAARSYLLAVAKKYGFNSIEAMNDIGGHRFVLKAFDQAIAEASLNKR